MTAVLTLNQKRLYEQAKSIQDKDKLIVVVKNDAYNFGMDLAFDAFYAAGVRGFATTNLKEAIELRKKSNQIMILLLDPSTEFDLIRQHNITLTVPNLSFYTQYRNELEGIQIQLVFKNLLNRFGFEKASEMITVLDDNHMTVTGIWTHFAFADELSDLRYDQEKANWVQILDSLSSFVENLTYIHAQNSASYIRDGLLDQHTHLRAGVFAYGTRPYIEGLDTGCAKQTIKVSATVKDIIQISKGQSAGYSAAFVAKKDTTLAICDIGYGNGILRSRAKHEVMINGHFYPIAVMMMSHLLIEVDDGVKTGDKVYIYNDYLRLDDFAAKGVGAFSEQMAGLNHQTFDIQIIPLE